MIPAPLVLAAAGRPVVPWRNGAGSGVEVIVRPFGSTGDDFAWRVSIATVDTDTAFSHYPGVDRSLMPLSPQGLDLDDDGRLVHLDQFAVYEFGGENSVSSVNVVHPTIDLNLMTRRDRSAGTLRSVDVDGLWSLTAGAAEEVAVIVLAGRPMVGERRLTVHDALLLESGVTVELSGNGRIAVAGVKRAR